LDKSSRVIRYIPILKEIAGRLTSEGQFVELYEDSDLIPKKDLSVVDCWVLFLRKRQQDAVTRDIKAFQDKLRGGKTEPQGAFLSFIRDPEGKQLRQDEEMKFDEWGVILDKQILFPLPANEEQVQILSRFEHSDGVVVWGPPGTGKSHTIANLICHFMAEGKRVLVTSQKDQALSVLHDMLPDDLRPLCMSVLSNVRDSREKLERAVASITEIVTQSQRNVLQREIEDLERELDQLREELAAKEREIKELSIAQFRYIRFEGEELLLADLIKRIEQEDKKHAWFIDSPTYEVKIEKSGGKEIACIVINPPLSDEEIEELKTLRGELLEYLIDLSYDLPNTDELVDGAKFQDIVNGLQKIQETIKREHLPLIDFKNGGEEALDEALKALEDALNTYKLINESWQCLLLTELQEGAREPTKSIKNGLIKQAITNLNTGKEELLKLYQTVNLLQSVTLPESFSLDEQKVYIEQVLERLRKGEGIFSFFEFNRKKKQVLRSILINGRSPVSVKEWEDILNYIQFLVIAKDLKKQWNNFARSVPSINVPQLSEDETSKQDGEDLLSLFGKLNAVYDYEEVYLPKARKLLSSLIVGDDKIINDATLDKIYKVLRLRKETGNPDILWKKLKSVLREVISMGRPHPVVKEMMACIDDIYDQSNIKKWERNYLLLKTLESLKPRYNRFEELLNKLAKQAPIWAKRWRAKDISEDEICPPYWKRSWLFQALEEYTRKVSEGTREISQLEDEQDKLISKIRQVKKALVLAKVKLSLMATSTEAQLRALKSWHLAVRKLGKGKGKYTWQKERIVQQEMRRAKDAVPVWIMPLYRVSEATPSEFSSFDVVIIDEASQCDIRALLALARGKKAIIVGDPEQISPEAVGINRGEIQKLIRRYLTEIPHKEHFDLETSLYDIANIVFSSQGILMLKEHFRCIPEIIEFSNRLCYDRKILPLRNPPPDERLEPVLERVFVEGGYREGGSDINKPEARAICGRIQQMVNEPRYKGKSFGVISLLGNDQARYIFNIIGEYITPEQQEEHRFRVGDSYAFQGDERDIILLSMVVGSNEGRRLFTLSYDNKTYRQRFNVAVSRARDKLILFHSVRLEDLKPEDLRYILLDYIQNNKLPDEEIKEVELKFESPFEEQVYRWLRDKGYRVTPQVKVGNYRIDLVVEGANSRLGIECDGDRWHPPENWWTDRLRQRQLERMGWTICRIWGSDFYRDPDKAMEPVLQKLRELKIIQKR